MTLLEFAAGNRGFVLVLALLAMTVIIVGIESLYRGWVRFLRMLAVYKHGWPPAHCDADGDPIRSDEGFPDER